MLYLVGSRFFGTNRDNSDFDFVGEDTPENRTLCEKLGAKRIESPFVRYHGKGFDICLVNNIEAQLFARREVKKLDVNSMSKKERHEKVKEFIDAYELGRFI